MNLSLSKLFGYWVIHLKKRSLPFLGYLVRDDKTVFHWAFHPRIPLCPSYLVIGLIFGKNWEKYFRHFLFSWWKTKYGWFFVPSAWWSLSALVIQLLGYLLVWKWKKSAIFFISWCSDMLPVQVIWLLGYSLNYIWVIHCPIYLMNPLCLGYSVIGLFIGLDMNKSAILFISWWSDMLPVQVIWFLGYLVN